MLTSTPTDGLKLVYQGGMPCGQFGTYTTSFNLQCDASVTQGVAFSDVSEPTQCSLQYTLRTAAACPVQKLKTVPSLGAGWIVFIVFMVALAVYLVGGSLYKKLVKGASGLEALPNIDTWRSVWAFITCKNRGSSSRGKYFQAGEFDGGDYYRADADGGSAVGTAGNI
jgi:Autophagy-related protein 27